MTAPLDDSQRFWDAHARRDPLWAVLSDGGQGSAAMGRPALFSDRPQRSRLDVLRARVARHRREPRPPQAAIAITALPQDQIKPADVVTLDVDVTNVSGLAWTQQQFGAIRLGNHWIDRTGERMLQRDDGRTLLPETLPPGLACRMPLTITAPSTEGDYACEIDLAHEGVRWFHDRDSAVLRFPVVQSPLRRSQTLSHWSAWNVCPDFAVKNQYDALVQE